jgi:(1->4)-alpha-D-glucan 1-alpha-D-glucosylmutase
MTSKPAPPPESTYRLQFHAGFTFHDATAVTAYLHDLGVTHAYASPYLKARPGSTHGYDVIDHNQLNPELGTEADYEAWAGALTSRGMGHVLDTVPNHAGVATNDNAWWNDVLEHGPASKHAHHFDIAWRGSPRAELRDKVLLPVLGGAYGDVLEKGELKLTFENGKPLVAYYDRRFPVSAESFEKIAGKPPSAQNVEALNGTLGDPRSFDALDRLLSAQHYRLAYWRVASDEINYRRFFDINDLAALSMERQTVFDDAHRLVFRLIREGKIAGLRIDHPDGLYDPKQYLDRLQARYAREVAGEASRATGGPPMSSREEKDSHGRAAHGTSGDPPPLYVLVEKILAPDEPLPDDWACHGTSGYDFLNVVNGLFVDPAGERALTAAYEAFTGDATPYADLVYRNKRLVLETSLASELQMLTGLLDALAQRDRRSRDFTRNGLRAALREVIACFPVYRSYVTAAGGVGNADRARVEQAVACAIERNPRTDESVFRFIRDAVLQKYPASFTDEDRAAQVHFAGKFQQLTAPVTAKGIEDTTFYQYNRLTSLNEVGGEPGKWGVSPAEAHAWFAERARRWPCAMSALSTHDTKRSEDVRARINVLSEMPAEFARHVERWHELNAGEPSGQAPSRNEEWLLYQTLIGACPSAPMDAAAREQFIGRIQAYMLKAMREAKVSTSWVAPNETHERQVSAFAAKILAERSPFLESFEPFQRRVARLGLVNSLAQTLLKLAAPGVPDTYQGTELLDFSLVDPDNRRPVDYERRRRQLDGLRQAAEALGAGAAGFASQLVKRMETGLAKLYVTWRMLTLRREAPGLFTAGEYVPLAARGPHAEHVFAFARRREGRAAVAVVPRLVSALPAADGWGDTTLSLPGDLAALKWRDLFTGRPLAPAVGGGGRLQDLFADFPVALLVSR